jgi:hypothetical protein
MIPAGGGQKLDFLLQQFSQLHRCLRLDCSSTENSPRNGCSAGLGADVQELTWGASVKHLRIPFDIVVACGAMLAGVSNGAQAPLWCMKMALVHSAAADLDATCTVQQAVPHLSAAICSQPWPQLCADVMYITEAAADLEATLRALSGQDTVVYIAHGRNRGAEDAFKSCLAAHKCVVAEVPEHELHTLYRAPDVTVLKLTRNL